MIYDILENKLIAGGFVAGESLFRNHMPAACTVGVMVRGPVSGIPIDPYLPDYYRGKMQVIVRHKDPDEGNRVSAQVQKLLRVDVRELYPASAERGEAHLDQFLPDTMPIFFPRLDGNGYEWSQHFDCAFGMKSVV
ncbi:hypothetical protein HGG70_08090 [Rhodobacteraceae bacterium R_SAG4]|nr:hypothetical protein [Rhodobacteraceae bacterium R_SAG4]